MTSSALTHLPSMGYDRPKPGSAVAGPPAVSVIRRRSGLLRVVITLSWIVGITGSFLTVGVIGMFAADLPPIHLKTLEDLNETELPMEETSMAELMAMGESAEDSTEVEPVEPVEIPETIQMPLENLDLPEIADAMTMEDVFAVPTAPKIENALQPVDPVIKRRPDPVPSRPRAGPVAKSRGTGASSTQAGAVGGGGIGNGNGKGRFPEPPYPAFAQSANMQGTVRLSISVGASGAVEGVSVIGSSGFSALDEHAASWVRRNYHWPAGATSHRYTLPLRFSLR